MSLSRKFKELYANPARPLESAPRRAKLAALQRTVEDMLAHLSAMRDFARMGGDVDVYEFEKQAANDDEYVFHEAPNDDDDAALLDVKGERVLDVGAAATEGAMQATYHRSIFQFRKRADAAAPAAERPSALTPLPWSRCFEAGAVDTDAVESAESATLRAEMYEQYERWADEVCAATLASAQSSAIEYVVQFVRAFVPRESVRTPLVRLPVAMLVEAGNASDHDVFHGHVRTRLRAEWPALIYVTLEPHLCGSWQRAVQAIGAQILPRDWRGVVDLREAHDWLRREFGEREAPRVVVVLRKFSALPRDVAAELLLRLEGAAANMPLFVGRLAVLLDVVHTSADEALIGVPWRVRMRLAVELIGMPSPRATGAAVADELLVRPCASAGRDNVSSVPLLFGADSVAYAQRVFVHGTMNPYMFHAMTTAAVLAHVRRCPAAWLACLPRTAAAATEGSHGARLWAALTREHVSFVACLPSVRRALERAAQPAPARDQLLASTVPSLPATVSRVCAMLPRWLVALDCARFRIALLYALFLGLRTARLLFVAEDDACVWWHAVAAGDARWATQNTRPLCPHATTPWVNSFTELHDEVHISSVRRRVTGDELSLAGLSRAELHAALARRLDRLKDEASAGSVLPLLQALLVDCAARLAQRLEGADATDEFGIHAAARVEHEAAVARLRAAAARLEHVEPAPEAAVTALPANLSAAARRKRTLELANPQFAMQERMRRASDDAKSEALAVLVDVLLFFAQPITRLPLVELVVVDQVQAVQRAVNPNRVANLRKVLTRPQRLWRNSADAPSAPEEICSAFRVYSEAGGTELNIAEWFRAFARVHWPEDNDDIDDAFFDDAAPENVDVAPAIAAKLHVFADALLQLQHLGVVGAIRKSRSAARTELVDRLI